MSWRGWRSLVVGRWQSEDQAGAESQVGVQRTDEKLGHRHPDNTLFSRGRMEALITLYRPVGQAELDLIRESGFRKFPPRLPEQPIFYPVLSEGYAAQIARDWNTNDERSGFVGCVLRFQVKRTFLDKYDVHLAGSSEHQEYWIPAADLEEFNQNIVGAIEVIAEFRGRE